jgi:TRAP-type C4-dicarboxylate transport system permease small subunit
MVGQVVQIPSKGPGGLPPSNEIREEGNLSRWVHAFVNYFYRFSLVSAEILLLIMTGLIALDVFARALFGKSTMISQEMAGYLLVAITFLGLSHTLREGRHITVELLTSKLSPHRQRQFEILVFLVCIVFMAWLTWTTWSPFADTFATGQRSVTPLQTPMWAVYFFVPLGSGMLTLAFVIELIRKLGKPGGPGSTDLASKPGASSKPGEGWGV